MEKIIRYKSRKLAYGLSLIDLVIAIIPMSIIIVNLFNMPSWQITVFLLLLTLISASAFFTKIVDCDPVISFFGYLIFGVTFTLMMYYTSPNIQALGNLWVISISLLIGVILGLIAYTKRFTTLFVSVYLSSFWASVPIFDQYVATIWEAIYVAAASWWVFIIIGCIVSLLLRRFMVTRSEYIPVQPSDKIVDNFSTNSSSLNDDDYPPDWIQNSYMESSDKVVEESKDSWLDDIYDKPYSYYTASDSLKNEWDYGVITNSSQFDQKATSEGFKDPWESSN